MTLYIGQKVRCLVSIHSIKKGDIGEIVGFTLGEHNVSVVFNKNENQQICFTEEGKCFSWKNVIHVEFLQGNFSTIIKLL